MASFQQRSESVDELINRFEHLLLCLLMEKVGLHQQSESYLLSPTENKKECFLLFYFYEELVKTLKKRYSVPSENISLCVKQLMQNYSHLKNGVIPKELEFNDLPLCLGYLHRYAVCHSVMVRKAMMRLFEKAPTQVIEVFGARKLGIVFLGSGPGNDLVGLLSALDGTYPELHDLDVTVVDKMLGWKKVVFQTIKELRKGGYGKASKIFDDVNIKTNFVEADLKNPSNEMKRKLKNADVTFLVKVLSNIPDSDKVLILKKIVRSLKPGSLLIFIDCPFPSEAFSSVADNLLMVYERQKTKFQLPLKRIKFGCENNTICTALVKVFVKQ